jgi:hypothetical protein
MGNSTSSKPIDDTIKQITHPHLAQRVRATGPNITISHFQNFLSEDSSPRLRYIRVLLQQGRLGKNVNAIVENCMRSIRTRDGSVEYITGVFDHIFTQVDEEKVTKEVGMRAIIKLYKMARWQGPYMIGMTPTDKLVLTVVLDEAYQRVPVEARRYGY